MGIGTVYRGVTCHMQFDMLFIPSVNLTQIFTARKCRKLNQNLKREENAALTVARNIYLK